jgi:hypothetical protein
LKLKPLQHFQSGLIVEKAAHEAVDFLAKNELPGKEHRV